MQGSCGLTHQNKHFIYGGGISTGKQVLEVTDCGLTSFGSLDFQHRGGACSSSNGVIVLCFDEWGYKQCRQATSPLGPWSDMTLSTFSHMDTQIAMSPGD